MQDFVTEYYLIIKALHIISFVAWMAGMLYLPRLYVYHADKAPGSEASEMLKIMEHRLLRYITNPAMIATFLFGGLLLMQSGIFEQGWVHMKLMLLFFMAGIHGMFARWRKVFATDSNTRPASYYRMMNEVPTVLMIGIVLLAVVKPF